MSVSSLKCSPKSTGAPAGYSHPRINRRLVIRSNLHMSFDRTDTRQVFIELLPVCGSEITLQLFRLVLDEIEHPRLYAVLACTLVWRQIGIDAE
jgi:hypothetical protein